MRPLSYFNGPAPTAPGVAPATGTTTVTTIPRTTCSNGSVVTGSSIVYTGATDPATLPPIIAPACPAGTQRTGFTTPTTFPGGATAPSPLAPWVAPTIPAAYPNCVGTPCQLVLTRTGPDGSTVNCTNTTGCPGYTGTGTDASGNTYTCRWGSYTLAASECTVIPTAPPTPGTGTTTPAPELCPPGSTSMLCAPATGTSPADPDAATNPDPSRCSGSFGWNPVDWVLKPVKCALNWAFGIKPTTQARVSATLGRAGTVPPFSVITAVPAWAAPLGTLGQSCPDWSVKVGPASYSTVCGQGFTQRMHDNRGLFGAAMTLALIGPLFWRVWRAAVPVLKVTGGS
jgi:hypothetical protein